MQQNTYYYPSEEQYDDINIDLKKIFMILMNRKYVIIIVFLAVLLFFVIITFILPKKYKVDADLYINKSNTTNLVEVNPYAIEELGSLGGVSAMMSGGASGLSNELEIIQSPLVIDKVIRENDLKVKKIFGIFPNRREGEYITTKSFLKKNISIENKKGTNVVTIEYKNSKPDVAYNVVSSIIKNYIDVSKDLHSEKAKNDTKILEAEYHKVKSNLNSKVQKINGLPQTAGANAGNLAALGAYSKAAGKALSSLQGQLISGAKSQIEIEEETGKMTQLATKLEWAKMVEEMSDSSKVLILKAPTKLRDFEYSSPKLLINILLGIIFGLILSFWVVVLVEFTDKKVPYSALGDNIIYNDKKALFYIQKFLIDYKDKNIACVLFDNSNIGITELLSKYKNINVLNAEMTENFIDKIDKCNSAVLLCKIGETDTSLYKSIKDTLKIHNKEILKEILV